MSVVSVVLRPVINLIRQSVQVQPKLSMAEYAAEKQKYLEMSLEEKREFYSVKNFVKLEDISSWSNYFSSKREQLRETLKNNGNIAQVAMPNASVPSSKLNDLVSLWQGDITRLEVDAVVNAANNSLLGGGGVDGAIHKAAGPLLKVECKTLHGCQTGDAKITGGYKLPAKYVIHTVGPKGEKPDLLTSCYQKSLKLALENNIRSIAFPCISTGIYDYPQKDAANVALKTVREFLERNHSQVDRIIFTLFLEEDVMIYETLMQVYFPVD